MAQLNHYDIAGSFQRGQEFGNALRVQREGEQRRNRLAELAGQAYGAPSDQRQGFVQQAAAIDPDAGHALNQQLGYDDDRRNRTMVNMARMLTSAPEQARPALYQRMSAQFGQMGMQGFPTAYTPETKALIDGTAQSIVQAYSGASGDTPSQQRYAEWLLSQVPESDREQALGVLAGTRARPATGGFGFEMIRGADGLERPGRQNPRTGTMEIYDESSGQFVPIGGGGSLNGGASTGPAAPSQPQQAAQPGSTATMGATGFDDLLSTVPGLRVTSGARSVDQNARAGGVANSYHLTGRALDIGRPTPEQDEMVRAWATRNGYEVIDGYADGHLHLEPARQVAQAGGGRAGSLAVGRSPEEQAARTEAAKLQTQLQYMPQQQALETQGAIARAQGLAGVTATQEAAALDATRSRDAASTLELLDEAERLLPGATGSTLGAIRDRAAGAVGVSTTGAQRAAALRTIGGQLTSKMPRMQGPQSDMDVQLYREMAGDLANDQLPVETRMVALETIRDLNRKYAGGPRGGGAQRTITRRGTMNGRRVVQYSDGSVEYGD